MLNRPYNTIIVPNIEEILSATIAPSKFAGLLAVILPDEVGFDPPLGVVLFPPDPVNANPTAAGDCLNTV